MWIDVNWSSLWLFISFGDHSNPSLHLLRQPLWDHDPIIPSSHEAMAEHKQTRYLKPPTTSSLFWSPWYPQSRWLSNKNCHRLRFTEQVFILAKRLQVTGIFHQRQGLKEVIHQHLQGHWWATPHVSGCGMMWIPYSTGEEPEISSQNIPGPTCWFTIR